MNGERIFVGRADELADFASMLERKVEYWVLALAGRGGMGKTRLLEQMIALSQANGVTHSGLIDFYYTDLQTETGLLSAIGSRLGFEHFPQLPESLEQCGTGPALVREEMLDVAVGHFVSGLQDLASGHTVAFFFDTFERAIGTGTARWFLEKVLPQMRGSAVVVLAGRNTFRLADGDHETTGAPGYGTAVIPLPPAEVCLLSLAPFSWLDVQEYLKEDLAQRGEGDVPLLEVPTIWEKSKGYPVIVALAADWLAEWGTGSITEIADLSPEEFERAMVRKVRDLETPEDEVIIRMAHVYHRFDAEILDEVYPELREQGFDSEQVIKNLSRLSFVKYWPAKGNCLLHDEVQQLVERYVWDAIDAAKDVRREISANAVKYYNLAVAREPDERTRWSLEAERIYHCLYSDLEEARPKFWHQMEEAWDTYRLDLMKMLLSKGDEVNARLRDPVLNALCQTVYAWVSLEEWNLEDARQLAQDALDNPACTKRTRATALAALGVYAERRGDEDRAIECYEQALDLCRNLERWLEQDKMLPDEYNIPDLRGVRAYIAFLLNSIGIAHRRKGLMDQAVAYFDQAREVAYQEHNLEWWTASLNNLGNIERLRGNLDKAFQLCDQALRFRERLQEQHPGLAYQRDLALSHNTFGMVLRDMQEHDEAQERFECARQLFEQLRDRSGLARAIRNIGWVCYLKGKTAQDPAARRKYYEEALGHYEDSRRICEASQIESELPNLWNKIGIAERALGNMKAAQRAFARGLEEARKRNDNLFIANNLVRLAEMAYSAHDLEQVTEYAAELRQDFQEQGFSSGLAYAEMEELLAQVAFDAGEYQEAFCHLGENYAHLARLNRQRFDRKFHLLEEFFDGLPDDEWRRRCAQQLIYFWKEQGLTKEYADLTAICEGYIM
jgi:tetratricopeptide (TPR) repeat protein